MIREWGVKNFKSIQKANLKLAPLTVFCGVNSSGKSAFLRSIAMLAQSVRTDDNEQITLNGDLVNLGSFEHIYNKNHSEPEQKSEKQTIKQIGIDFAVSLSDKDITFFIEYGYDKKFDNKEPHIFTLTMKCKDKNAEEESAQFIKYMDLDDMIEYDIGFGDIDGGTLDIHSAREIFKTNPYRDHESETELIYPFAILDDSCFFPKELFVTSKFRLVTHH